MFIKSITTDLILPLTDLKLNVEITYEFVKISKTLWTRLSWGLIKLSFVKRKNWNPQYLWEDLLLNNYWKYGISIFLSRSKWENVLSEFCKKSCNFDHLRPKWSKSSLSAEFKRNSIYVRWKLPAYSIHYWLSTKREDFEIFGIYP